MNKNKMYLEIFLGSIIGVVSPFVIAYIIYKLRYNYISPEMFKISKALLVPLLQYGALGNLAIFFSFNYFNKDYWQRGIIMGTIIVAMYIVYLKFFGH